MQNVSEMIEAIGKVVGIHKAKVAIALDINWVNLFTVTATMDGSSFLFF